MQGLNLRVVNSRAVNCVLEEEAQQEFSRFWTQPGCGDLEGRDRILSYFCPQVFTPDTLGTLDTWQF